VVTPQAKREWVKKLQQTHSLSERKACGLVNIQRSSYRYEGKPKQEDRLKTRLKELATQYPSYGYLLLHGLLKQEGLVVNKKRTYRLYLAENLQVRTKKRKKLTRPRQPMSVPTQSNQRWSMDFVSDQLSDGRRFRILNVIDDFSRECLAQYVNTSISGAAVANVLTQIVNQRGKPSAIVCDNGKEFTSRALFLWADQQKVKLAFIQPGKPTQNAFIESFNGKFRAACLNLHWFRTLNEARAEVNLWTEHYNQVRPHSALNYLTPSLFMQKAA